LGAHFAEKWQRVLVLPLIERLFVIISARSERKDA
jgi:hypothetical protein